MANTHESLSSLFTDIADAIREKTGDTGTIVADLFPEIIRENLQSIPVELCLTFSSPNAFSIKTKNTSKNWDGTLEYSTDKKTWSEWNGAEISAANGVNGYNLYLRGVENTRITGNVSSTYWVLTGSNIACNGNIETLLDHMSVENNIHPGMSEYCYKSMFHGCTSLTTAPELTATMLTTCCYMNMFYGCTSLITAPELPATTLAGSCYQDMFHGCTSLTTAPELPATTLIYNCYMNMFYGCTSLTTAPELPATTLSAWCYGYMFYGCTSLITAPELPATKLDQYCYQDMFRGCTSLTTAPELCVHV